MDKLAFENTIAPLITLSPFKYCYAPPTHTMANEDIEGHKGPLYYTFDASPSFT